MSTRIYKKHPEEIKVVDFDFSKTLTTLGDTAAQVGLINDPGLLVTLASSNAGVYRLHLAHGKFGTQYNFGVELLTAAGARLLDIRRVRVQGVPAEGLFDALTPGEGFVDANDG